MRFYSSFLIIFLLQFSANYMIAKEVPVFEILDESIIDYTFLYGGTQLIVGKSGGIEIWDMKTKSKLQELDNSDIQHNTCVDVSPDNRFVIAGGWDGKVLLWDLKSMEVVWEIKTENKILDVEIASDNLSIAVGSSNSNIYKVDLISGEITGILKKHRLDVMSLEFRDEGKYLFSASADRSIMVWDYKDGIVVNQLTENDNVVKDIKLNIDESRLVSCGLDGVTCLWYVKSINNILLLEKEKVSKNWLSNVNYYKDGSSYISSDLSGNIFLFAKVNLKKNFKKPIIKTEIVPKESEKIEIMVLFQNYGICIYDVRVMY
jgi:WD domain, G-beta repeat